MSLQYFTFCRESRVAGNHKSFYCYKEYEFELKEGLIKRLNIEKPKMFCTVHATLNLIGKITVMKPNNNKYK